MTSLSPEVLAFLRELKADCEADPENGYLRGRYEDSRSICSPSFVARQASLMRGAAIPLLLEEEAFRRAYGREGVRFYNALCKFFSEAQRFGGQLEQRYGPKVQHRVGEEIALAKALDVPEKSA